MASFRRSATERKLSFDVLSEASSIPGDDLDSEFSLRLYRSKSEPPALDGDRSPGDRKRRKKNRKKKTNKHPSVSIIPEDHPVHSSLNGSLRLTEEGDGDVLEEQSCVSYAGELRQRNVSGGNGSLATVSFAEMRGDSGGEEVASSGEKEKKANDDGGSVAEGTASSVDSTAAATKGKLETAESLDWKKLMAEDPNYVFSVEQSPLKYFMDEMHKGNALRSTTTVGSEKERERVYDTIFRLPWRCELLIDVGFFVCFDSFLSLLTFMPTRIVLTLLRFINTRQFKKPSAAELSDIGCFILLVCGVVLLGRTDISLIYHMIRGQGIVKLYVVYNVLEIFDKLCQSFGGDVLETLFNSAEGLASCSPGNLKFWMQRFIYDQALATAFSILHSYILLAQAMTLSTCIVAHNNALLALLISNNFAEIKSNVFKRFSKENIHNLVYADSVERFHICAFLLSVLAQNILEAEGPWFRSFLSNALMVYLCEMLIDIIKHSFLAKFNDIKPIAYSEFLEELCNQTLDIQSDNKKKNLTFVPLAPACVVIRILTPVYAAHIPYSPLVWRLFWILLLLAMTYVMLTSLKIMIGMGLKKHASWYVRRCRRRRHHHHYD